MRTTSYPSDLSDAQWALVEPLLPPAPQGGRPRKTEMRDVVDAILYVLRTGSYCQELCFEDGLSGDLLDSIDELLSLEKEGDLLVTVETTPTLLS